MTSHPPPPRRGARPAGTTPRSSDTRRNRQNKGGGNQDNLSGSRYLPSLNYHEQGKLCAIQRPAPAQTGERCLHQPEVRVARAVRRHEFPERAPVQCHRLEEPHPPVVDARQHPVPLAAEHRHAEATTFVEREPVAVGAPHGKKTTHRRTPYPRPRPTHF